MITLHSLTKAFEGNKVLEDLSLEFSKGKVYCLFGPSGCGKTTLLNSLTGGVKLDNGAVEGMKGMNVSYVFQEDRLLPWWSVYDNLMFALEDRFGKLIAKERINYYSKLVELDGSLLKYPDELSGGMKQRASIARALAYGGDILIMDEPFKGLHFSIKRDLMDHIIANFDIAEGYLIFVTHDIDEALYLADEIIVMEGPPIKVLNRFEVGIDHKDRFNQKEKLKELRDLIRGMSNYSNKEGASDE